jgi:diadenosine tetraphosphate (Ap4A) HIT family hydrolase
MSRADLTIAADQVAGCRFCFLPEPWRVVWSTPNFNVQMGLGPLAEGYALILSKFHYSCCAELPAALASEFEGLVRLVKAAQINLYGQSIFFEHGRSGACLPPGNGEDLCYHAHLHVLPAGVNLTHAISGDFEARICADWDSVRGFYTFTGRPYLLAEHSAGIAYAEVPDGIRSRYLRRAAAAELGTPELEDWVAFPSYSVVRAGRDQMAPEFIRIAHEPEKNATSSGPEDASSTEGRAL